MQEAHSFRNNFADEYKQKGAEVHISGETMGHRTQSMTYGTYGSNLKIGIINENIIKYVTYEGVSLPWRADKGYNKKVFPWE